MRRAPWASNGPNHLGAVRPPGEFADDKLCPRHSGKYCKENARSSAIGQAVLTANASLIEAAMAGPGSVDDMAAQVRLGIKCVLSVNLPVDVWNTCG